MTVYRQEINLFRTHVSPYVLNTILGSDYYISLQYYGGTIVNRTYGTPKTCTIRYFFQQYLVVFTMVPRKYYS